MKQLIEKRNAIFSKAVNEYGIYRFFFPYGSGNALVRLIEAFSDAEDPVALLVASAQELIPLNTSGRTADLSHIPDPENRQPIAQIIEEFHHEKWYHKQIRHRRTIDAKAASLGRSARMPCHNILTKPRDTRPASFRIHRGGVAGCPENNNTVYSSNKRDSGAVKRERRHCVHEYGFRQISDLSGNVGNVPFASVLIRVLFS